jgi:excisionase family DNA binding protein
VHCACHFLASAERRGQFKHAVHAKEMPMRDNTNENTVSQKQVSNVCRFPSELLSRKEAAVYLGVSEQTLAIWKTTGRYSLPVVKIGRLAKYRKADLDAFILGRVQGG